MVHRFIEVKNGIVENIVESANRLQLNNTWQEVPPGFNGSIGDKWPDWFDDNKRRIPDAELVRRGERKDNTGRWYHKEKIGETKLIHALDEEIGDDWTREEPLKNEPYQKWDNKKNKFIVDEEKKQRFEKESALADLKFQIVEIEKKTQRPLRAKIMGRATKKDEEKLQDYESEIERLRLEVNSLEKEL